MTTPTQQLPILVLLTALREEGATHVVIEYSGGGDSGGIDSITAIGQGDTSCVIDGELHDLLMEWGDQHAFPQTGWWNNEGGSGTCTIDLATMEATVEHTDNEYYVGKHIERELTAVPEPPVVTAYLAGLAAARLASAIIYVYAISSDDEVEARYPDHSVDPVTGYEDFADWLDAQLKDLPVGSDGGDGEVIVAVEARTITLDYRSREITGHTHTYEQPL